MNELLKIIARLRAYGCRINSNYYVGTFEINRLVVYKKSGLGRPLKNRIYSRGDRFI